MMIKRNQAGRFIQAQIRDARVLIGESRYPIVFFLIVVGGGTLLLYLFYTFPSGGHLDFSHALYATFAMLFFQPVLDYPVQVYLRPIFFIVPFLGLAALANGILNFSIALTNKKSRGQKWQIAMASTYRNHVILCGLGKVGYSIVMELNKFGREIIVIESNENGPFIDHIRDMGIPLIIADARQASTLTKANIKQADSIIPCTDEELTNLDIALGARELHPGIKVVMRMFDPDLAKRIEQGFGIHTTISISALTAPMFAAAAMRVNVKHSFYIDDLLMNISEVIIEPGSRLAEWTVAQLESELNLSVIYYQEGKMVDVHPSPNLPLLPGVRLLVMATVPVLQQFNALNKENQI